MRSGDVDAAVVSLPHALGLASTCPYMQDKISLLSLTCTCRHTACACPCACSLAQVGCVCARSRGFLAGAASIRVIWLAGPGSVQTDVMPDDGMLNGGKHDDANEMDRESWGLPVGGPIFTSLEQLLSYNVRGKPRAVFTRLATGTDKALEGEIGSFEMPLVHGARLQLGRFDPDNDGPGRKDKIVLSMADRRGLSRCHGSLECREGRFLIVWPVTEKTGFPTWVNGDPIGSCTTLRSGDWLGFGAISGRPVLEFGVQLVNLEPASKVLKPKANPGAPVPVHFGLGGRSISASPDLRTELPASDSELSTDWSPKPDDEGGGDRSSKSTLLERAQRQLAEMNKQSTVLERAQRQLAEMKLELQEKEAAHEKELSARASLSHEAAELRAANEKERSARTSLSNEAAELRGEITILRGFLADQAADQVYLSPTANLIGGPRAALFARKPSSPCSTSEPATPVKAVGVLEPGWPTTDHTSPSPPRPPPRKLKLGDSMGDPSRRLKATPSHARNQSSQDVTGLSGSDPVASPLRRSSSGTSPLSGASPLSGQSSPSVNEVRSITKKMNSSSAEIIAATISEIIAAEHTAAATLLQAHARGGAVRRAIAEHRFLVESSHPMLRPMRGWRDPASHHTEVEAQLDWMETVMRKWSWRHSSAQDEEVEAMQRREAAGVGGLTQLLRDTQAHVRRVSDSMMHLSDPGRTLPSPTGSSARPAEVCSPSPSRRAPRTCLAMPRMSLDCLGSPSRHAVQDVVSVSALDPLGRPTSTSTV